MASEQAVAASVVRSVWLEQPKYEAAERHYYEIQADRHSGLKIEGKAVTVTARPSSITDFIGETKDMIEQTLMETSEPPLTTSQLELQARVAKLEEIVEQLTKRIAVLEAGRGASFKQEVKQQEPRNEEEEEDDDINLFGSDDEEVKQEPEEDEDDDIDLFGSDDEDEKAAEELKQRRVAEYEEKKSKKPKAVAKSSIILDVKPWDDDTDMKEIERSVRSIVADGLVWGQSKLIPLAYGIQKLQIGCVVEDDKIGIDFLEEEITKFEDVVQSVDIAAFNKI